VHFRLDIAPPNFEDDRNDMALLIVIESNMERRAPNRAKARTERTDPSALAFKADTSPASRMRSAKLNAEPSLQMARIERDDPKVIYFITDIAFPEFTKYLTETTEPMLVESYVEKVLPSLEKHLTDIEEPKCI
jgi:hypothetical protein